MDSTPSDNAVRTAADVAAKKGTMVEAYGTYEQVAYGKLPDAKPQGHAAVRLDDGTLLWLEPPWHPDAIRSSEELAKYAGTAVVVNGLLFDECPPPPDGRAYALVACLMKPVVIDRRAHDFDLDAELEKL